MSNPSADFALSSWTRNGITFSNCRSYWNLSIYTPINNYITIVFPNGLYKKAGFDISAFHAVVGNYTIKVTSGNCIYTYAQPANIIQLYFFGINLPTAIDKIEVMYDATSFVIDNFRFGN